MEFAYLKLMQEHGLGYSELPEDAQTAIDQVKDTERSIKAIQGKGRKATAKTIDKLRLQDKTAVSEILDYIEDKEELEEAAQKAAKNKEEKQSIADPIGLQIDAELEALYKTGNLTLTRDDLQVKAPISYKTIFDGYNQQEENGIETSFYKIIENKDQTFTISK